VAAAGAASGHGARELAVPTARGEARIVLDGGGSPGGFALALTHGAGGGVDAPDLLAVRDAGLALGGAVARISQPYLVRGARAPGAAARQDEAWIEILAALRAMIADVPLIPGGRSNGARLACRTARAVGAAAVIALAFPLHPPGRPDRSRLDELRAAGVEVLAVSGARDPFGIPAAADATRVVVLPGESHALSRDPAAVGAAVDRWLREWLPGHRAPLVT
jgi:predicted alpha/beta-hydrolase family hydrolase